MNAFTRANGLRYGFLALPLAFVLLPLYVVLPHYYAGKYGVALGILGAILLGTRLLDALLDPLIGRWIDRLFARSAKTLVIVASVAGVVLAAAFTLLFFPPPLGSHALLWWVGAMLTFAYVAFSTINIGYQAWAAQLGGSEVQRSALVAWREGFGLLGVILASLLPLVLGMAAASAVLCLTLVLGLWAWGRSVAPSAAQTSSHAQAIKPFRSSRFRQLFAVFMFNGIASAVPATLVLFFVQDRLQASSQAAPIFLATYFVCAVLSIPLWLRAIARWGLARAWLGSMVLAVAVFAWTSQLGAGQELAFALVCALSGLALGADLIIPSALLAGVVADNGHTGQSEGVYFGWWNFAAKLNLALAAGLSLPLLQWAGYAPGVTSPQGVDALVWAYCGLPCVLKLIAALLLWLTLVQNKTNKESHATKCAHPELEQ